MDQHVSEAEDGWIEMQRQADEAQAEHLGLHPAVSLINDDGDWVSVEAYKALEAERDKAIKDWHAAMKAQTRLDMELRQAEGFLKMCDMDGGLRGWIVRAVDILPLAMLGGSSSLKWAVVQYGDDEWQSLIVDHTDAEHYRHSK